ncbi:holo-ACP synthase [Mesoplasma photuris]|uniref:holo-ACP synthase n=1 Tax=Mesoplasma photuris TaxID=217731 RepID=UPI0004E27124|nr:4'-phosphopantetheinyl transferase superfamily protein [Mesoplasma photuris]
MIKKVGIDIVENNRLNLEEKFLSKVLTIKEIDILNAKTSDKSKLEFLGGRWAIKEAIIKTLDQKIPMNAIEINYDDQAPIILNEDLKNIHISISHETNYSVGMAVREDD